MKNKGDLDYLGGLSISETIDPLVFSCTNIYGFPENDTIREKTSS